METDIQMEKEHVKLPTKNNLVMYPWKWDFVGGAMVKKKNLSANAGDTRSLDQADSLE